MSSLIPISFQNVTAVSTPTAENRLSRFTAFSPQQVHAQNSLKTLSIMFRSAGGAIQEKNAKNAQVKLVKRKIIQSEGSKAAKV